MDHRPKWKRQKVWFRCLLTYLLVKDTEVWVITIMKTGYRPKPKTTFTQSSVSAQTIFMIIQGTLFLNQWSPKSVWSKQYRTTHCIRLIMNDLNHSTLTFKHEAFNSIQVKRLLAITKPNVRQTICLNKWSFMSLTLAWNMMEWQKMNNYMRQQVNKTTV